MKGREKGEPGRAVRVRDSGLKAEVLEEEGEFVRIKVVGCTRDRWVGVDQVEPAAPSRRRENDGPVD